MFPKGKEKEVECGGGEHGVTEFERRGAKAMDTHLNERRR
jgi:hypothetical protein